MKLTTRERQPVVSAVGIRPGQLASTGTDGDVTRFVCVDQMAEPSRKCGKTASSDDLFQNVASQLLAAFRVRGGARPVAKSWRRKVRGRFKPGCKRFSGDPAWAQRGSRRDPGR